MMEEEEGREWAYKIDLGVACLAGMDVPSVGEDDIETHNLVESETPCSRGIAISAMGEVTTHADTRPRPMG